MATSFINKPDNFFGGQGILINDFNDQTFFINLFQAPNMCRFIPFKTATLHQPLSPSAWGFCLIYYGGAANVFLQIVFYPTGEIYTRQINSGTVFQWFKHTPT